MITFNCPAPLLGPPSSRVLIIRLKMLKLSYLWIRNMSDGKAMVLLLYLYITWLVFKRGSLTIYFRTKSGLFFLAKRPDYFFHGWTIFSKEEPKYLAKIRFCIFGTLFQIIWPMALELLITTSRKFYHSYFYQSYLIRPRWLVRAVGQNKTYNLLVQKNKNARGRVKIEHIGPLMWP